MTAMRMPTGVLEEIRPFRSRSLTEATLFRGHGETENYLVLESITEPCACGLAIVALSDADEDIVLAVRSHQRMPEHQLYRIRYGGS